MTLVVLKIPQKNKSQASVRGNEATIELEMIEHRSAPPGKLPMGVEEIRCEILQQLVNWLLVTLKHTVLLWVRR